MNNDITNEEKYAMELEKLMNKSMYNWDRNQSVYDLHTAGKKSYFTVSKETGLHPQRVYQVVFAHRAKLAKLEDLKKEYGIV